jgi:hypothetical protein
MPHLSWGSVAGLATYPQCIVPIAAIGQATSHLDFNGDGYWDTGVASGFSYPGSSRYIRFD